LIDQITSAKFESIFAKLNYFSTIMEISEIKTQLKIETVLTHYGLQADKNGMLSCPFHNDKKPSFQI
jgi:hypothetical protein